MSSRDSGKGRSNCWIQTRIRDRELKAKPRIQTRQCRHRQAMMHWVRMKSSLAAGQRAIGAHTQRRQPVTGPTQCAPAPTCVPVTMCTQHTATACATCRRLGKTAQACCDAGHHEQGHVAKLPLSHRCSRHNLPPSPRCTLTRRGVTHCCNRGHHNVVTPTRTLPCKRPSLEQGPVTKRRRAHTRTHKHKLGGIAPHVHPAYRSQQRGGSHY